MLSINLILLANICCSLAFFFGKQDSTPVKDGDNYGVDVTFPIHHYLDPKSEYGKKYDAMMSGCYKTYSKRECDATEEQRLEMSMDQPSHHYNFTDMGFKKMKAPAHVYKLILDFYNANIGKETVEKWPRGNTYVNHWDSPTEFISLEDPALGGGQGIKNQIWEGMRPILEEWVGEELQATSLYGIRLYRRGSILSTHVDRLPLITSAIVQIAQDVDEDWPIEVYGHDGKAYNVTMKPGEMALYESHTVLHGRPFPLKGNTYANIFVHFKPKRYDDILREYNAGNDSPPSRGKSLRKRTSFDGPQDNLNHVDADAVRLHQESDEGKKPKSSGGVKHSVKDILKRKDVGDLRAGGNGDRTILHEVAQDGDLKTLKKLLRNKPKEDVLHMVNAKDENGWQPLHEAVRLGDLDIVRYLIEECGAEIDSVTLGGGTALWWALEVHGEDHGVVQYLQGIRAPNKRDERRS